MPKYEQIYDNSKPRSPVIEVKILDNENEGNTNNLYYRAIIDTGSPISAIPNNIIDKMSGGIYTTTFIKSPLNSNQLIEKKLYLLTIEFGENIVHEIKAIAIDREYGILGRDVINKHKVILDAPNDTWSIE